MDNNNRHKHLEDRQGLRPIRVEAVSKLFKQYNLQSAVPNFFHRNKYMPCICWIDNRPA